MLLALALVLGGVPTGMAPAGPDVEKAAAAAPCHEVEAAPEQAGSAGCCLDQACTCDCLHPVTATVLVPLGPTPQRIRTDDPPFEATLLAMATPAPDTRPPIA